MTTPDPATPDLTTPDPATPNLTAANQALREQATAHADLLSAWAAALPVLELSSLNPSAPPSSAST